MIFMNLMFNAAFALDCDPGDNVCTIVDDMTAVANSYYAGKNPIADNAKRRLRPQNILNRLRVYTDALENNGCIADTSHYQGVAGSYRRKAGSFNGEIGGDVVGTGVLDQATAEAYADLESDTPVGNLYSQYDLQQVFMNHDDNQFVIGVVVKVGGARGVYVGVTADCQGGTEAGAALDGLVPGAAANSAPMSFQNLAGADQIERMGMPAVNTALIVSKDSYNESTPEDDINGDFVPEIVGSIDGLHAALDDDLTGAGLTPCTDSTHGLGCVGQGAPLVVPDTITIVPVSAPGFPNGRTLPDPVIDVTLAVLLLDLNVHPVTTLIGLNPTANDKPFAPTFPFLAAPH